MNVGGVGQIAFNAALGGIQSFANTAIDHKMRGNKHSIGSYIFEVGTGALIGGIAGKIGGAGAELDSGKGKAVASAKEAFKKRVANAGSDVVEIAKAQANYAKNTTKLIKQIRSSTIKSVLSASKVTSIWSGLRVAWNEISKKK